uniref:Glutamine--fructose-6-phosphate aminotransferase [isomerizing] n=1 Tax=Ignisphaera aggregans TaxID=334771 RepID=A0A7C5TEU2_9CREN
MIGFVKGFNNTLRCLDILREGLKKLEYRGYDSVGIAVVVDRDIIVVKDVGVVDDVIQDIDALSLDGYAAIGHTRWATHGRPSKENAHPHMDCFKKIALVHNGVIENYIDLKKLLSGESHVFLSETDTEVVVHLIEHFKRTGMGSFEAFKKAISMVRGSYAIAAIDVDEPNKIFFARNISPLVIGVGDDINFVSSDITPFIRYTDKVIVLNDGEIGYISSDRVYIETVDGRVVDASLRVKTIDISVKDVEKRGYMHYMAKEIMEQPYALAQTFSVLQTQDISQILKTLEEAKKIYIVGAGSSYHTSLLGAISFKRFLGIDVEALIASEFKTASRAIRWGDVVVGISQSGETIDTLLALREAREKGAKTIAVVNNPFSTIAREADYVVSMGAGPEIAVAATKTFTTQVLTILYIVAKLGERIGSIDINHKAMLQGIKMSYEIAQKALDISIDNSKKVAYRLADKHSTYYLGRLFAVPIAMEGALKLKEVAYIHAEAYPAGESKHGPIALIEKDFPVIFIYIGFLDEAIESNIEEMKARDAWVATIASEDMIYGSIARYSDIAIKMPRAPLEARLITYAIPLQLIAYSTSIVKGIDPDKPRNLAKTVTVI